MTRTEISIVGLILAACFAAGPEPPLRATGGFAIADKVIKSDAEWQRQLDNRAYQTTREGATEWAYTGDFWDQYADGVYRCVACGLPLFSSEAKYDSKTGWPSFFEPVVETNVYTRGEDRSGLRRTEVLCSRCDGHLGHLFEDGPEPTGLRYCINSSALVFEGADQATAGLLAVN